MARRYIITARHRAIYEMRQSGLSFRAVAEKFGVTRERIRQVCIKTERSLKFRVRLEADIRDEWQHWTPEMQVAEFDAAYGVEFF
jgi:DNA-directed RNA polymerase sigma subunit (sigma70/sigma32)